MRLLSAAAALLLAVVVSSSVVEAFFVSPPSASSSSRHTSSSSSSALHALDPVTYLRTEWISAALCTNQTPRSADVALILGCEDGRIVNFVPRTIRKIITSSAESKSVDNGALTVSCERQLKQQAERRNTASIELSNQPADNLKDTQDASVDVVISLQAAQRMYENGLDFKQSIKEAGRVLKPGGRFLFVESVEVGGESYLDYVMEMSSVVADNKGGSKDDSVVLKDEITNAEANEDDDEGTATTTTAIPVFEEVGYDNVDMVLQPHIAGIAIKAMDADLSLSERAQKKSQEEEDRLAEMSFAAFERGNKRRKRKKKKNTTGAGAGMGE
jgi:SAM-dependent methyltransferase